MPSVVGKLPVEATTPANVATITPTTAPASNVSTPSYDYNEMACKWDMLHDLLGGTKTMRNAAERWLPREPKELPASYANRLGRSFLYNAYKNTLGRLIAKPFSQPVTTKEDLPEGLADIPADCDRAGKDLTAFARDVFTAGLTYGLSHILVDFPTMPETYSLADQRQLAARPVFIHVKPTNLIGWTVETNEQNQKELTEIRVKESRVERTGVGYEEKCIEYIRVYTKTTWELWKQIPEDRTKFVPVSNGTHTFGAVPLKTFYVLQTGWLTADPPLEDLAWLNIAHWQSLSDQRNILRFARVGILFGKGMTEDEVKNISVGPNNIFFAESKEADLKFVGYSGEAIKAGADDLITLEERMEILGLQPLIKRSSGSTATGKIIDEGRTDSDIQSWIRNLETVLRGAFELAAQWMKVTIPDDFAVDIFNDFSLTSKLETDVVSLIAMRTSVPPQIDHKTFLEEIKRRGTLSDAVNIDDVMTAVESEGPSLASLTGPPPTFPPAKPPVVPPTKLPVKTN